MLGRWGWLLTSAVVEFKLDKHGIYKVSQQGLDWDFSQCFLYYSALLRIIRIRLQSIIHARWKECYVSTLQIMDDVHALCEVITADEGLVDK